MSSDLKINSEIALSKATKKNLVEAYLETLMKMEEFPIERLLTMNIHDLLVSEELAGISKSTISKAFNTFKMKHSPRMQNKPGLHEAKKPEKNQDISYLDKLMNSLEFGVDDLMNLTTFDLSGNIELEGIGKSKRSGGLKEFKTNYLKNHDKNKEGIEYEVGVDTEEALVTYSAKQKIEEALKTNPKISLNELKNQLPEINPVTLKPEFYKLKRKLFGPVPKKKVTKPKKIKKKSNRQQVAEYLNKNAEASIDTLQSAFTGIRQTTLRNYLSTWKKEQGPKEVKPSKKDKSENTKPAKIRDDAELIETLKKTIAAQDKTIKAMSKTLEHLSPESDAGELKGMTIAEIKRVAATYLRSIKELPTKLRG